VTVLALTMLLSLRVAPVGKGGSAYPFRPKREAGEGE